MKRMSNSLYLAVDLGAGSGRVFLAGMAPGELLLEEVRRFHYPPRRQLGHLRWDLAQIFAEIKAGLRAAGETCATTQTADTECRCGQLGG
jgi:rhamnulokinase